MKHKLCKLIAVSGTFLLWVLPFQTTLTAQEGVSINKIAICKDVVDRTPVEPSDMFEEGTAELYCFTAVANPGPKTTITHVWTYEGQEKFSVELTVGKSPNWRTWSKKAIPPESTGSWNVTVLDPAGAEIASADFTIGAVEIAPEEVEEEVALPEEPAEAPEAPEAIEEPEVPEVELEEEMVPPEAPEAPEAIEEPEVPEVEEEVPEVEPEEEMVPPEEPEEVVPEDTVEVDTTGQE